MRKNVKENNFLLFNCLLKKFKEKSNINKITKKLIILKLFNLYIDDFK